MRRSGRRDVLTAVLCCLAVLHCRATNAQQPKVKWNAPPEEWQWVVPDRIGVMMVVGEDDRLFQPHRRLVPHLEELKIEHEFRSFAGVGHNLGVMKEKCEEDIVLMLARHYEAARIPRAEEGSQSSVDLGPSFDELGLSIRSQGGRGTCSAFTITRAIEYAVGKKERRSARLSVEFLNWASNETIGKQRDGGFFSDLWKGFEAFGICDEAEMPYADSFDPGRRPSEAALKQAGKWRKERLRMNWIKPWDPTRGLTEQQFVSIKDTLRQGWPVCGGFLWPKQAHWSDEVLQMAARADVRDGHSVLLVGFRDDSAQPGGGVFLIQNTSKGPRQGAMSYEYVRAYMNDAAWIGNEEDGASPQ